ncbi:gamma-glutamyl-gamma-aminobutyrate hydrolase family protein [Fluviispira multicolorata]|uniref:Gamma-glutamyl-gamma-aminobutyrate hydrolase family protein n=1 Tax=Fluviispira multicolorata TaxID=2654512 RepID=A0A833JBG1_9BACT|nr:gamma-glutamyl-gamma-aminobutyrate hydrolase family protein [Fluviispira multicolorata]KAB8029194.1 gamma-glutamyl-gamma-aminobutyrate hydrolase family protein [Fluviispira multicolorata]
MTKPIIGVLCCARMIDDVSDLHHLVFRSYIDYIKLILDAVPILIPAILNDDDDDDDDDEIAEAFINSVDGIILPGSPSNVGVRRKNLDENECFYEIQSIGVKDLNRDMTAMKLIKQAYLSDKPLLGICRGFQEINIFFGGELYQELHKVPGKFDHRSDKTKILNEKYELSHLIKIDNNSLIRELLTKENVIESDLYINSLHSQGIEKLGNYLAIEGKSEDNTIEAFRHKTAKFIYGVQWHMEWNKSKLDAIIAKEFRAHCLRSI